VQTGDLTFYSSLQQEIPRALLQYEGKVKAVITNDADRMYAGDQVFLMSLEDYAVDHDAIDIPVPLQAEADRIATAFTACGGTPTSAIR